MMLRHTVVLKLWMNPASWHDVSDTHGILSVTIYHVDSIV